MREPIYQHPCPAPPCTPAPAPVYQQIPCEARPCAPALRQLAPAPAPIYHYAPCPAPPCVQPVPELRESLLRDPVPVYRPASAPMYEPVLNQPLYCSTPPCAPMAYDSVPSFGFAPVSYRAAHLFAPPTFVGYDAVAATKSKKSAQEEKKDEKKAAKE
ncbi:hypothetical protein L596_012764 [Steinernema carpocapsae]|nr:hypothetical protein L596_012764 [Steinernema carpocapsae]